MSNRLNIEKKQGRFQSNKLPEKIDPSKRLKKTPLLVQVLVRESKFEDLDLKSVLAGPSLPTDGLYYLHVWKDIPICTIAHVFDNHLEKPTDKTFDFYLLYQNVNKPEFFAYHLVKISQSSMEGRNTLAEYDFLVGDSILLCIYRSENDGVQKDEDQNVLKDDTCNKDDESGCEINDINSDAKNNETFDNENGCKAGENTKIEEN